MTIPFLVVISLPLLDSNKFDIYIKGHNLPAQMERSEISMVAR
jgi:hypothetical protein